jgi:hypothetical protein
MISRFAQVLGAALLTGACASYAARSVPILQPTAYDHQQAQNGVIVAADVYGTAQKYRRVFDTAPSYERGYLGINVVVFNDSTQAVLIDPANAMCVKADGTEAPPIPATQVAEQVLRSTTGRYFAGGVLAAGSSKGANDRIRADFAAKALTLREVPPGGRNQGFVFCPNETPLTSLAVRGLKHGPDSLAMIIALPGDVPLAR